MEKPLKVYADRNSLQAYDGVDRNTLYKMLPKIRILSKLASPSSYKGLYRLLSETTKTLSSQI